MKTIQKALSCLCNALLPEVCPSCSADFLPPAAGLCPHCAAVFEKFTPNRFQEEKTDILQTKYGIQDRMFYFAKWHYLWTYQKEAKTLYQNAKLENRKSSRRFLFKKVFQVLLNTGFSGVLVHPPSSDDFLPRLLRKSAAGSSFQYYDPFYKITRSQIKKKEKAARFKEIESSLFFDPRRFCENPSRVIILDDVWSTGATLNRCAFLLNRAGIPISQIEAAVLFFNPSRTD